METNHTKKLSHDAETAAQQSEDGYCTIYKMDCPDGCGIMTVYKVFPGIELIYDEFNATNCFCANATNYFCNRLTSNINNIIEINHCREGRSEYELQNGSFIYVGKGDLSINVLSNHAMKMEFPLKHYVGIEIILYLDELYGNISRIIQDASIDIFKLKEKFCPNNECFIMRAKDKIEHIFSELYTVPVSIQKSYFKLKVLELLLFLSISDVKNKEQREYYSKNQIETIKQIKDKITSKPKYRYTIEELSDEYGISQTELKTCFKDVYGTSIGAYTKIFRMQYAGVLLKQTNKSILEIASDVGYENQSRFAAAFKEIMGSTPLKYRKND